MLAKHHRVHTLWSDTTQNYMHAEIKSRLNSGRDSYYSLHNLCFIVCFPRGKGEEKKKKKNPPPLEFCLGLKLGLSHCEGNIGSKVGSQGKYFCSRQISRSIQKIAQEGLS
jgi:hypothetical protein